jgi:hypothetical protein
MTALREHADGPCRHLIVRDESGSCRRSPKAPPVLKTENGNEGSPPFRSILILSEQNPYQSPDECNPDYRKQNYDNWNEEEEQYLDPDENDGYYEDQCNHDQQADEEIPGF